MYVQNRKSSVKYLEVCFLDILCLNISFISAYLIYIDRYNPYLSIYRNMIIVICLANIIVVNFLSSYDDIERRGYLKEFLSLLKQTAAVFLLGVFYLFTVKDAEKFLRVALLIMASTFFVIDYLVRVLYKKRLANNYDLTNLRALLILTELENAKKVLDEIASNEEFSYNIKGFVITDSTEECDSIGGYPVVCTVGYVADYVCHNWVDDVLIVTQNMADVPEGMLRELSETGVAIHIAMQKMNDMLGQKQFFEPYCGYNVITSCMNEASPIQIFLKRLMDILGGFFGCLATVLVFIFIGPVIKIKSPGPVFFNQKRVGQNGKVFTMYKFRSMHMDAEERKEDLASENRVSDGMMFKIDFDPRIIGNEILPDGTHKTGIGDFIRRTSIDEFPQFFNVLKGDMSLVGTRPPTLDEWSKYDIHHRARLAIKPGITGMWQVSGRSEITDFEEIVALDTKYINEWSLSLDVKILFKTVAVVFKKEGAL